MGLSFDDIIAAQDIETREVDVPEWGGKVRLKGLSGAEVNEFEASKSIRKKDPKTQVVEYVPNNRNLLGRLVALSLVDEHGNRLVPPNRVDALGTKSGGVLNRLADVISEMSGMDEQSEEEIEAFSEGVPSDSDSSS